MATDDFIAVIDGSTSKSSSRINESYTNGSYCMQLVSSYIRSCPPDITVDDFCRGITDYIYHHYPADILSATATHPEMRMAASCGVLSLHHREIWLIGDCQCLVDNIFYDNPKPYEDMLAAKRAVINTELLETGRATVEELLANDKGREAIIPEMIETMQNQNKTYAVIDGYPIPLSKVRIVKIPAETTEIVMATDGYPFLLSSLAESEKALQEQKANDPLNISIFKATKAFAKGNSSFDDRSYVRLTAGMIC